MPRPLVFAAMLAMLAGCGNSSATPPAGADPVALQVCGDFATLLKEAARGTETAAEERASVKRWYYGHGTHIGAKDADAQVPEIAHRAANLLIDYTQGYYSDMRGDASAIIDRCRAAHAW